MLLLSIEVMKDIVLTDRLIKCRTKAVLIHWLCFVEFTLDGAVRNLRNGDG